MLQVTFDDEQVSFDQLLEVFWAMHDPTQVDRQGPDRRRPVPERDLHVDAGAADRGGGIDATARRTRFDAADRDADPEAPEFYPAEDYHQAYYEKNGHEPYCHVVPVKVLEEQGLLPAPG